MALQWQGLGQGQVLALQRQGREEEDGEGVEEGGSMSEEDDEGSAVVAASAQISSSSSSSSSGVLSSAPTSSAHTNDYTYCACTSLINFWRSPIPTGYPIYYCIPHGP